MNKEALISMAVEDLCNATDHDRGRRLALVRESGGWRIGYQVPRYRDQDLWSRGDAPVGWDVLEWLDDRNGLGREVPYEFGDLAEATGVALGLRVIVLARVSAVARAGARPGELLIVVEAPPIWTLEVEPTRGQKWRWAVMDPTGTEVAAEGDYDSEDSARANGEAELATWAKPDRVLIV